MTVHIEVVTRAPKTWGNMALAGELFLQTEAASSDNDFTPKVESFYTLVRAGVVSPELILNMRQPVFELGEILFFANGEERDIHGRKPEKWDVTTVAVDNLDVAVVLSRKVREAHDAEVRGL